jgi:hypothetical protein
MKPIGSSRWTLNPQPSFWGRGTDLGFTRDRHIKCASRLQPTCGAPSRRPHPEELGAPLCAPSVSKDGRSLDLACGRPSRRAQPFEARAPSGARAPQDDARSSGRGSELAAAATAISSRRYSVAECCNFALLQVDTAEQNFAEQIFLANEARLMHKRASFRTVIKARCGLLRRAFVLGV